jgi:hypothetical protein
VSTNKSFKFKKSDLQSIIKKYTHTIANKKKNNKLELIYLKILKYNYIGLITDSLKKPSLV